MFGLIIRGLFFAAVVGWYSTSLWRMIDGYFMERFKRYLAEEFDKNPLMRGDMASDKSGNPLTDEALQQLRESCGDECAGKAEHESMPDSPAHAGAEAGAAGKEVARAKEEAPPPPPPPLAFDENAPAEPPDEREELCTEDSSMQESLFFDNIKMNVETREDVAEKIRQQQELSQVQEQSNLQDDQLLQQPQSQQEEQVQREMGHQESRKPADRQQKAGSQKQATGKQRKRRSRVSLRIGAKSAEAADRQQRQQEEREKFQPLTYGDFFYPSRKRKATPEENWEFSEFDEEPEQPEQVEEEEAAGVLVAELPFKPAVDIYDLERVSGEEYCPLTLEEDPAECEESRPWP